MKYNHGDAILCGSLALMLASPWLKPSQEEIITDETDSELLRRGHQACEEASCPCGFKLNLAKVDVECDSPNCTWRDRDTCCIGDFASGDYPPCYGLDPVYLDGELIVSDDHDRPEGWPTMPDLDGHPRPITSPMMREMAMDSYRGCTEAHACEESGEFFGCRSCVSTHCAGLDSITKRPKAAPWYPKSLSGVPEWLVFEHTCEACFLSTPNGRGDGRSGCAGIDDWLTSCGADTPLWESHEGKTCMDYQFQMKYPSRFRNNSLQNEVKHNCCQTWKCTKRNSCPTTTTTTTTVAPVDLSLCPQEYGCHETRSCPCTDFVSQIMGYEPWRNGLEEQRVRANCCKSAKTWERIKTETDKQRQAKGLR